MRAITPPLAIIEAVNSGAVMAVSISGGKDSQALLKAICDYYAANNLQNKLFAIHADLGRAEWKQTPSYVEKMCKELCVELVVVRAKYDGQEIDLLDRIKRRVTQLQGQSKPPFPSALARYCTSDLKTKPINDYLRQFDNVISIEGICWHESKQRANKPMVKVRKEIATKGRKALTWNAIIDWSLEDVWNSHGQSIASHKKAIEHYDLTGEIVEWWNFHPAYAMGNTRLSCSICIFGNKNDFANGIKHNPEYAEEISLLEIESGYTFKQGVSILNIIEHLKQSKI